MTYPIKSLKGHYIYNNNNNNSINNNNNNKNNNNNNSLPDFQDVLLLLRRHRLFDSLAALNEPLQQDLPRPTRVQGVQYRRG